VENECCSPMHLSLRMRAEVKR